MVTLERRVVRYERQDFALDDILSMKDAAEMLGLTLTGLITAVNRGRFTELIDPDAVHSQQRRRFLLRSEVEEEAERRGRLAKKWGEGEDGAG